MKSQPYIDRNLS